MTGISLDISLTSLKDHSRLLGMLGRIQQRIWNLRPTPLNAMGSLKVPTRHLHSSSPPTEGLISTPIYPKEGAFPELTLETEDLSATALVAENAGLTFFGSGYTILLYGDIGAGKTTFARHFISAFLDEENASVSSPTFTLDTTYVHPLSGVKLHHMDLYRIEKEEELNVLNLPKIYENATSLIEWPDRLHNTKYMPESYVVVHLLRGSENEDHSHVAESTDGQKTPQVHYHDGVPCTGHHHSHSHGHSHEHHHEHDDDSSCELEGEPRSIHISCVNMGIHGRVLVRQLIDRIERSQE